MRETYVINILYTQNSTWQGTVDWVNRNGEKKSQCFRSALELIRLIDSSVSEKVETECREAV